MKTRKPNDKGHTPNSYPIALRLVCLIFSISLLAYAIESLYSDDFLLPSMRTRIQTRTQGARVFHLHGYSVWVMFLACLATAANLLSHLIDHYDKRDNEHKYEQFAKVSARAGWFLLFSAIIIEFAKVISKSI